MKRSDVVFLICIGLTALALKSGEEASAYVAAALIILALGSE